MSIYHHPRIVTDGLVLHLDAANKKSYPGSGTVWYDLSSYKNHGSFVGTLSYSNTLGGTISFGGSGHVSVNHHSSLELTTDLTLEIVFNKTGFTGDWVRLIGKGGTNMNAGDRTYGFWHNNSSQTLYQRMVTSFNYLNLYGSNISNNNWYHIMAVTSGSNNYIYFNGRLVSSAVKTATYASTTLPLTIGYQGSFHYRHIGNISIAKVYNRGLTATEVLQNYNATKSRYGL